MFCILCWVGLGFHRGGRPALWCLPTPSPGAGWARGPRFRPRPCVSCVWAEKQSQTHEPDRNSAALSKPLLLGCGQKGGRAWRAWSLPAGGALCLPGARPSSWADLAPLGSPAINSCAVGNGGCQHNCIQLTVTQHRCQCRPEFQLQEDGKRCTRECATSRREGEDQGWDSHWVPRSPRTHGPAREPRSLSPALLGCWCWRGASGAAAAPLAAERLWGIAQPLRAPGRKPVRLWGHTSSGGRKLRTGVRG